MHGCNMINNDAVDFLGHGTIAGAQAGLDMGDRDVELGCSKRACECGIGIAIDQQASRPAQV